MEVDISQLSSTKLAELRQAKKNRAARERKAVQRKHAEKRRALVKQVHELLKENHLTLDDVLSNNGTLQKNRSNQAALQTKYRNPLNHKEIWSGKGRQPNWLIVLLQEGKTKEDFAI